MKTIADAALRRTASNYGIQVDYIDAAGKQQVVARETLLELLQVWGVDLEDQTQSSAPSQQRIFPPVLVVWDGRATRVRIDEVTAGKMGSAKCELIAEDGTRVDLTNQFNAATGSQKSRGMPLSKLPEGYHQLQLTLGGRMENSLVLSARTKTYSAETTLLRNWGLFCPMYALRSRKNWGAGDLSSWAQFGEWVGAQGGSVVSTLPLLANFLDQPVCEPSPYSPASRLFWNEFFIDVTALPEFEQSSVARRMVGSTSFQKSIHALRSETSVNYADEMALKRKVLEQLAKEFFDRTDGRRVGFENLLKERPELQRYAQFRAACDQSGRSWHTWNTRQKAGKLRPGDFNEAANRYHLYAQFAAQTQYDEVLGRLRKSGVQFYLDLPLGVHPDSYDCWANQNLFVPGASVGSPPDAFFTKGQKWGFPPLNPVTLRETGYGYVIDYLRFQMRHTGMLRLDHVMGLHRLYCIPNKLPATHGAYVRYPAEELYAILSIESHRFGTALVGENLGTVPPEVNERMARHGIRQMYVLQYEQQPRARALRSPPKQSVASLNTHDMPTWAAHWQGLDLQLRQRLGILSGTLRDERVNRKKLHAALATFLTKRGWLHGKPTTRAALGAALKFLAGSPAETVLINLEDLWLEPEPQNVPGTTTECNNWRRKTAWDLETVIASSQLRKTLREINALRKKVKSS